MEMSITELREIMRASGGADDSVDLDGDILDVSFADLGYDSLALLEIVGRVGREYRVDLGDDSLPAPTPRAFIDLVNGRLVNAA